MKKAFKSLVILAFCLAIVVSTVSFSLAAPGSFELKASVTPTSVTLKWTESKDLLCSPYRWSPGCAAD